MPLGFFQFQQLARFSLGIKMPLVIQGHRFQCLSQWQGQRCCSSVDMGVQLLLRVQGYKVLGILHGKTGDLMSVTPGHHFIEPDLGTGSIVGSQLITGAHL